MSQSRAIFRAVFPSHAGVQTLLGILPRSRARSMPFASATVRRIARFAAFIASASTANTAAVNEQETSSFSLFMSTKR